MSNIHNLLITGPIYINLLLFRFSEFLALIHIELLHGSDLPLTQILKQRILDHLLGRSGLAVVLVTVLNATRPDKMTQSYAIQIL